MPEGGEHCGAEHSCDRHQRHPHRRVVEVNGGHLDAGQDQDRGEAEVEVDEAVAQPASSTNRERIPSRAIALAAKTICGSA